MKKNRYADRIKDMGTTIFTAIGELANKYDAVKLSQGAPDYDTPKWIIDEVTKGFYQKNNQYAPLSGVPLLKESISNLYKRKYDLKYNSENITITSGATEAIFDTVFAFINLGDEVILFEPFYDSYPASVEMAGGVVKAVTLKRPDFSFTADDLEKAFSSRTKMIILNSPHNPTGKVFSQKELKIISEFAIKYDLLVLSDEVYEFLTFGEDNIHYPIASLEGMYERTITISSTGKTLNATGWKIGYACSSEDLINGINKVHQFNTFAVITPVQVGIARVLDIMDDYLLEFRKETFMKKGYLLNEIAKHGFKPIINPGGTYFFLTSFDEFLIKNNLNPNMKDFEFTEWLIINKQLALIPVSGFYNNAVEEGEKLVRFNFAKSNETLNKAILNLK